MKQILFRLIYISFSFFLITACSKEYSYESGNGLGGTAVGILQDSSGNCQNIIVKGTYTADTVLTDSNYVILKANITTAGKYKISTDTANGFWFRDSGYATSTGIQNIKLKGYGKPILPLDATFTVTFGNSVCQFTVSFGSGGTVSGDYFPTTAGSYWTYKDSQLNDTLRTTATNLTYTIGSNTYTLFTDKLGDSSLYRKSNGIYYEYARLYDSTAPPVEYIFLKDNVAVGSTWDSPEVSATANGTNIKIKYHFTILSRGGTASYNNHLFNNVIKVQVDIQALISPSVTYSTVQTAFFYYGKGVGLLDINVPGSTPPYSSTITAWHVN